MQERPENRWERREAFAWRGQLLRPDEDTLPVDAGVVDDERRTEALEVLNAQLQVFEVHPSPLKLMLLPRDFKRSSQNGMRDLARRGRRPDRTRARKAAPGTRPFRAAGRSGFERTKLPRRSSSTSGFCPTNCALTSSNSLVAAAGETVRVSMCLVKK